MCDIATHWSKHIHRNQTKMRHLLTKMSHLQSLKVTPPTTKIKWKKGLAFSGNVYGVKMHAKFWEMFSTNGTWYFSTTIFSKNMLFNYLLAFEGTNSYKSEVKYFRNAFSDILIFILNNFDYFTSCRKLTPIFVLNRNTLYEIYFGKTRDIVNGLRSVQSLSDSKQQDELRKDLFNALAKKNVPKAEWPT